MNENYYIAIVTLLDFSIESKNPLLEVYEPKNSNISPIPFGNFFYAILAKKGILLDFCIIENLFKPNQILILKVYTYILPFYLLILLVNHEFIKQNLQNHTTNSY